MSTYTDLFVVPVPTASRDSYRKLAEVSAVVWKDHGALSYFEVEADDAKSGKWTSFPQSVDLKDDEFVVVAVITYRSREHRDEVNAQGDSKNHSLMGLTLGANQILSGSHQLGGDGHDENAVGRAVRDRGSARAQGATVQAAIFAWYFDSRDVGRSQ